MAPQQRPKPEDFVLRITEMVADREGTTITELPRLANAIDPDALVTLVEDPTFQNGSVAFSYAGYSVTVTADSDVDIQADDS